MQEVVENLESFKLVLEKEDAFVLYFNTATCNVGEAVGPKIEDLLNEKFPRMKIFYVNSSVNPDVAAQLSVFTFPTALFFFGGKESARKARHFSMVEVEEAIERPYDLLFGS